MPAGNVLSGCIAFVSILPAAHRAAGLLFEDCYHKLELGDEFLHIIVGRMEINPPNDNLA